MLLRDVFFEEVRPLFGGRLKEHQVDGLKRIAEFAPDNTSLLELAYIYATVYHETARWMQPIREGAIRYGPKYTNEQSVRAVTAIFNKGIISKNYAIPDSRGRSYYGRGLVQITWKENYEKFSEACDVDLVSSPDAALEWDNALLILFQGMKKGMFTGKCLDVRPECDPMAEWTAMRAVVNGDGRLNGRAIAGYAEVFHRALLCGAYVKEVPDVSASDSSGWSFLAYVREALWSS